jgi:MFS family permease
MQQKKKKKKAGHSCHSGKCPFSVSVVSVSSIGPAAACPVNSRVAFNSTPSYTYFMVERFGIAHTKGDIAFYLGLITTSFLATQSLTNPFWGWTSDRIGRKPVVLTGTLGTLIGFLLFGFSETYVWVLFSHATSVDVRPLYRNYWQARSMPIQVSSAPFSENYPIRQIKASHSP